MFFFWPLELNYLKIKRQVYNSGFFLITEYAHTEISAFHITVDTLPQNDGDKSKCRPLSNGELFTCEYCLIHISLKSAILIICYNNNHITH